MKTVARVIVAVALVLALSVAYRRIQQEGRSDKPVSEISPRQKLSDKIANLPPAPAGWRLVESAPEELNDPDQPDIRPALEDLIASARERLVLETYVLHKSFGKSARMILEALKNQVQVLGVVHPNTLNDMNYLAELRQAGSQIVERDMAPVGGNPAEGYVHAKFLIADGRRGYIGTANFNGASMSENREMGIVFEDAPLVQNLEMVASLDAGRAKSVVALDLKNAVLLQGAAEEFQIKGLPLCEEGVAALCEMAKKEIDVMMFTFSHAFGKYDEIATPMRAAIRRGVKVRLIHDARTLKELKGVWPTLRDMKQWGVDVRVADIAKLGKAPYGQYHAKAMCVDGEFLMIGSNNWTEAASHENRETALILRSRHMSDQFLNCFNSDWNSGYARPFIP